MATEGGGRLAKGKEGLDGGCQGGKWLYLWLQPRVLSEAEERRSEAQFLTRPPKKGTGPNNRSHSETPKTDGVTEAIAAALHS